MSWVWHLTSPTGFVEQTFTNFNRKDTETYPIVSFLVTRLYLRFDPAVSPVTRLDPYDPFSAVSALNFNYNAAHGFAVEVVMECHALRAVHGRALKSRLISWLVIRRFYINIISITCSNKRNRHLNASLSLDLLLSFTRRFPILKIFLLIITTVRLSNLFNKQTSLCWHVFLYIVDWTRFYIVNKNTYSHVSCHTVNPDYWKKFIGSGGCDSTTFSMSTVYHLTYKATMVMACEWIPFIWLAWKWFWFRIKTLSSFLFVLKM